MASGEWQVASGETRNHTVREMSRSLSLFVTVQDAGYHSHAYLLHCTVLQSISTYKYYTVVVLLHGRIRRGMTLIVVQSTTFVSTINY